MERLSAPAKIYRWLILGLVIIQLLGLIVPVNLTVLDAICAIGVSILGLPHLSRSFQIATFVFFLAGLGLMATTGLP
jgi:hypothetical protein